MNHQGNTHNQETERRESGQVPQSASAKACNVRSDEGRLHFGIVDFFSIDFLITKIKFKFINKLIYY